MEILYNIAWRRDFSSGYKCNANGEALNGESVHNLKCLRGCSSSFSISRMSFICTDFSIEDNWTFGKISDCITLLKLLMTLLQ